MPKEALQNLTTEEANEFTSDCKGLGGIAEMIPQSDGLWTVACTSPDPVSGVVDSEDLKVDIAPDDPADGTFLERGVAPADELGKLSAKYESRGGPGAIGKDSTGGFSYGAYQIATKTGTMKKFLQFLDKEYPSFAQQLETAGGPDAALAGTDAFKSTWKTLGDDDKFFESQHNFIRATHYEPFADRLKATIGLDVRQRSAALKDVAWSVAVQHGPANSVFKNALSGSNPAQMDDKDIINAVYDERSKVDIYFAKSTPEEKQAVLNRFTAERKDALSMLS